ncbi:MAG TPA: CHAP domain-containing protein [Solirubrobacterales bacterium]|jgi:surface antigen|nr:CHAP domain-containing protein [Solirubrobacterales bacterium]
MTNRLRRGRTVAVVFAALAIAAQARAATGGYPYWSYDGPGSNPATYTWTDAHGNGFSPYGYAYRNCTDYVAWKLSTANRFGDYRGLGNAVSWASAARARGYRVNHVPEPGAVAWWGSEKFGGFGHVAWVVSVDVGSVEIAEYNHGGNGRFDLRRIVPGAADAYIHFKDLPVRLRDGDFVSAPGVRGAYRLVGGAPVYVSRWSGFGGRHPVLLIDRARFEHLPDYPANGTLVSGGGHPYRIAGGAPIAIGSWVRIGGRRAAMRIDAAAIAHAGEPGRWSHLRSFPRDHTILRAGPLGSLYSIRAGVPRPIPALPPGRAAVVVDPAAIANAGGPGVWRFLRARAQA